MYGLSEKNIKELTSILASFPHIEEAIIYGSRAKGNYRSGSDVDLSLKGAELTYKDVALLDDKLYYSYIPYYFDTIYYFIEILLLYGSELADYITLNIA